MGRPATKSTGQICGRDGFDRTFLNTQIGPSTVRRRPYPKARDSAFGALLSRGRRYTYAWIVAEPDHKAIEERIRELKVTLERYATGGEPATPAAVADLSRAVHEMGDHVMDLHRRLEAIEKTLPEWTTQGWTPPPGSTPAR